MELVVHVSSSPLCSPTLLDRQLVSAMSRKRQRVSSVVCMIDSPYVVAFGKTISIQNDRPFVLTEKFLASIADQMSKDIAPETEGLPRRILERACVGAKIRGYDVTDPIGQTTDQCDLAFFVSMVHAEEIDRCTEIIHKVTGVPRTHITFRSDAFAALCHVRQAFYPNQALHIRLSEDSTDISVITNGLLQEISSFPCGSSLLIHTIRNILGTNEDIARSAMNLFVSGNAAEAMKQTVARAIADSGEEWISYVESIAPKGLKKVFLSASGEMASIFTHFLTAQDFAPTLVPHDLLTESLFVEHARMV